MYYRGIQTVRGYKPADDVEEKIEAIAMEMFGNHGDWRSNSLEDRKQKFKVHFFYVVSVRMKVVVIIKDRPETYEFMLYTRN